MARRSLRRSLLLALAAAPFARAAEVLENPAAGVPSPADALLTRLESDAGGRLGVFALNTADGQHAQHRADERFPFCSTFKLMLAGAILARGPALLKQRIRYSSSDLVSYSPISGKYAGKGMTVAALCAATLQYSDNTAANLLIQQLGGVAAVTAFARSIGDQAFRLDRMETQLNTALPGDLRDTTTPAAMAESLNRLVLGDALAPLARKQLKDWLLGNTTGDTRIRAGVPSGWLVGDKTGTGDYGSTNDIGIIWPPGKAPIVLAVYYTQQGKDDKARSEVIAEAARIALAAFKF
ncbi:class A beta-lactamase [Duganella qianjiadongensis]|uniref:class A beta-lactamase n=1 Tax=Duganella qianjiadongensis TaxID=2692176 RepID=UPI00353127EF